MLLDPIADNNKDWKPKENTDPALATPSPLPAAITIPNKLVRRFSFATLIVPSSTVRPIAAVQQKDKKKKKPKSRNSYSEDYDVPSTTHAPFTGVPLVMDHLDGDHFLDMDGFIQINLPSETKLKKWRPLQSTAPIVIVMTSSATQGI
jgi:hypothetical protein